MGTRIPLRARFPGGRTLSSELPSRAQTWPGTAETTPKLIISAPRLRAISRKTLEIATESASRENSRGPARVPLFAECRRSAVNEPERIRTNPNSFERGDLKKPEKT